MKILIDNKVKEVEAEVLGTFRLACFSVAIHQPHDHHGRNHYRPRATDLNTGCAVFSKIVLPNSYSEAKRLIIRTWAKMSIKERQKIIKKAKIKSIIFRSKSLDNEA